MSTLAYITLTNSNASLSKKFRIVMGTLTQRRMRVQQADKTTVTGKQVLSEGSRRWMWQMTLRLMFSETDGTYGTKDDLFTLANLNNPNGTPSNQLTFVDNLGNSYTVYMLGDLDLENLTPYLDGSSASFLQPITLKEVL